MSARFSPTTLYYISHVRAQYIDDVDTYVYTFPMTTTTIRKWGNSYAIRLPKVVVDASNLRAGNMVEIRGAGQKGMFMVVPVQRRFEPLAKMVARITQKNSHSIADWGRARGKEVW